MKLIESTASTPEGAHAATPAPPVATLAARMRTAHFPVSAETLHEWLSTLLRVCDAVEFAHSRLVVHRDLKPANIMVGPHGEVYVMDWGLARRLGGSTEATILPEASSDVAADDGTVTRTGEILGTPGFMAPEQARGETIGPCADVFSLGAILREMIHGDRIVNPASVHALSRRRNNRAPKIAPELLAICDTATAYHARDRFQSVNDLREDLRRFIDGRVVRVYARGPWQELRKWVQRNRLTSLSVGSAVLVVVTAAWLWIAATARADGVESTLNDVTSAFEELRIWAETEHEAGRNPTVPQLKDHFEMLVESKSGWRWWVCIYGDGLRVYNRMRVTRLDYEVSNYFRGMADKPDADAFWLDESGERKHVLYDLQNANDMIRNHNGIIRIVCCANPSRR
jgi:hypothetical protein